MRKEEMVEMTKGVIRAVAPHLPAIVAFAALSYVLGRIGLRGSLASSIAVPIIVALVTEFVSQALRAPERGRAAVSGIEGGKSLLERSNLSGLVKPRV